MNPFGSMPEPNVDMMMQELLNPRTFRIWLVKQANEGRVFNAATGFTPFSYYMQENTDQKFMAKFLAERAHLPNFGYVDGTARWCEILYEFWWKEVQMYGPQLEAKHSITLLDKAVAQANREVRNNGRDN